MALHWERSSRTWSSRPIWSAWDQKWPDFDNTSAISTELGPKSANFWLIATKVVQLRLKLVRVSNLAKVWPMLGDFSRLWPKLGQVWPGLGQIWPTSAKSGRPTSGRVRPSLARIGQNLARLPPNLREIDVGTVMFPGRLLTDVGLGALCRALCCGKSSTRECPSPLLSGNGAGVGRGAGMTPSLRHSRSGLSIISIRKPSPQRLYVAGR